MCGRISPLFQAQGYFWHCNKCPLKHPLRTTHPTQCWQVHGVLKNNCCLTDSDASCNPNLSTRAPFQGRRRAPHHKLWHNCHQNFPFYAGLHHSSKAGVVATRRREVTLHIIDLASSSLGLLPLLRFSQLLFGSSQAGATQVWPDLSLNIT